eukprot:6472617-Amphidinium_carterae.1
MFRESDSVTCQGNGRRYPWQMRRALQWSVWDPEAAFIAESPTLMSPSHIPPKQMGVSSVLQERSSVASDWCVCVCVCVLSCFSNRQAHLPSRLAVQLRPVMTHRGSSRMVDEPEERCPQRPERIATSDYALSLLGRWSPQTSRVPRHTRRGRARITPLQCVAVQPTVVALRVNAFAVHSSTCFLPLLPLLAPSAVFGVSIAQGSYTMVTGALGGLVSARPAALVSTLRDNQCEHVSVHVHTHAHTMKRISATSA